MMLCIQDIIHKTAEDNKNYQKPIKVNVIKCSTKTYYTTNKVLYHMALADTTGTIKATCYNEDLYYQTKEKYGLLIWNFIFRNNTIIINKHTKIARCPAMELSEFIVKEAEKILQPPAPPASPIKTIKEASLKTLMTVCGTVAAEEEIKQLFICGHETNLKTITLKDATDFVKITLWREATNFNIQIGQDVQISHVTVHEFNNEIILNTTKHSQIQAIKPPTETLHEQIYGIKNTEKEKSTITTQVLGTDTFESMDQH
ncbi:uncharacterized protein LOC144752964 [Lissotriton helveticus]